MTGALLSAALAALLWPDSRGTRRQRLAALAPHRAPTAVPGSRVDPALAAAVAVVAVGALVATPLVAALGAVAAFVLARRWRSGRAERRSETDLRELADGLAVVAAELRSGRSLTSASETAGALGVGRPLADAVLAAPTGPPRHRDPAVRSALERVAAGAALSARTGCRLATVLTAVEDDLRARVRQRLELRAATAGPRAGAAVLAGLPLLGLAMGSGVGADPWRVLTTTPPGQVLLVVGVGLELAGLEWTRRLVDRALR